MTQADGEGGRAGERERDVEKGGGRIGAEIDKTQKGQLEGKMRSVI